MSLRRSAGHLLASVVLSVVASVGVYCMWQAWANPPRHSNLIRELFKPENMSFRDDPVLGWTIIPNSRSRGVSNGQLFDIYYGRYGERTTAPGITADPLAELVFVGCSLAWGQGVREHDVAIEVLARKLGVKAINLAVPGTGTLFSSLQLQQLPELQPKYIVYLFYEDHLWRNVRVCAPVDSPVCVKAPTVQEGPDSLHVAYPRYYLERLFGGAAALLQQWYMDQYEGSGRTSYWKDLLWKFIDLYNRAYKAIYANENLSSSLARERMIRAFDFSMARMAAVAHAKNAKLVVVYIPLMEYPTPLNPLAEDELAVLQRYGATIIDMAPEFNSTLGTEPKNHGAYVFTIPNDGHLSVEGHRMIAERLLQVIR